jgi:hypothetical protein
MATTMTPELSALCAQLKQWRQQGGGGRGKRVPGALWQQAATVAQADGAWKTARATRLNYDRLRARMAKSETAGADQSSRSQLPRAPAKRRTPPRPSTPAPSTSEPALAAAQFVAVQMKPAPHTPSLTIEPIRQSGERMRI